MNDINYVFRAIPQANCRISWLQRNTRVFDEFETSLELLKDKWFKILLFFKEEVFCSCSFDIVHYFVGNLFLELQLVFHRMLFQHPLLYYPLSFMNILSFSYSKATLENDSFPTIQNANQHHGHAFFRNSQVQGCLLYTSPSPRDGLLSRMPSSA